MAECEFDASVDQLENVTAFVEQELEKFNCTMKAVMQIDVAVEEIFVNIAHYAYGAGKGKMSLAVSQASANSVSIVFKDNGVPFDPLAKEDPDISRDAADREIGGLGIFMVKKTMDKVEYKYENGQNILTIEKSF